MTFSFEVQQAARRRDEIIAMVSEKPGIHVGAIATRLHMPRTSVMHHLGRLQRQGRLRLMPHGGSLCVVPEQRRGEPLEWLVALADPMATPILKHLDMHGPLGLLELAAFLGETRKRVRRVVGGLASAGVVGREPGHRGRFFLDESRVAELEVASAFR